MHCSPAAILRQAARRARVAACLPTGALQPSSLRYVRGPFVRSALGSNGGSVALFNSTAASHISHRTLAPMAADGGKQQQTIAYGGLVASAAAMLGLALLAASSGTDPKPKPAPHAQPAVVPAVPATVPAVQPVAMPESEDTGGSTPSEPAAQTDSASENVSPAPSEGSTATAVAGTKLACYREPPSRIFTLDEVRADHGDETWVVLSDTRGVYNMTCVAPWCLGLDVLRSRIGCC